jgi:hypothetical protein
MFLLCHVNPDVFEDAARFSTPAIAGTGIAA